MSALLTTFVNLLAKELPESWKWLQPIIDVLKEVLWPILILVGTAGMIYAVVLGVKLAQAETADAREEAKKRIINAVIALVVIIALILLLQIFVDNAPNWIGVESTTTTGGGEGGQS